MGALFNAHCYATVADASSAYYGWQPMQQTAGTTSYRNYYKWSGTVWQHIGESISSTGVVTQRWAVTAAQVGFPMCNESESFNDGITLGWAVAGVMVVAWGWRIVRRQMGVGI